jgi:hypothetical protein
MLPRLRRVIFVLALRQTPLYFYLLDRETSVPQQAWWMAAARMGANIRFNRRREMATTNTPDISRARSFQTVNPTTGENGHVYQGHSVEQAASISRCSSGPDRLAPDSLQRSFATDGEGGTSHPQEP